MCKREDLIRKKGYNYAFNQAACKECKGACCIGESGNIFATKDELFKIMSFLKLEFEEFKSLYLKKVGLRYSFKEDEFKDGFACIFFDKNLDKCSIYPLRPTQCKTFPFWEYFKENEEELRKECIGICF